MLAQKLSNRKIIVDILALMFGLGAWIGVNGIFVQLPLLVNTAPEGWTLPAHMVMLVQVANLGPILYTLYIKYSKWVRDSVIIYCLLGLSTLATYLLSQLYMRTSTIFGEEHSTALLSLMFITSVMGCTSSVLFMPYMRNYREIYLVSYLVGEGLSGFIPSAVALIQGVGGSPECTNITQSMSGKLEYVVKYQDPRFSSKTFFLFLGTLILLSFLSFTGLNKLRVSKGERVKLPESTEMLPTNKDAPASYKTRSGWTMSKRMYCYLLVMVGFICLLSNATLPSIQSYSAIPYGNTAYHLTITLASMSHPLAMCLGFIINNPKVSVLSILMAIGLVLSGFIIYLATQSPNPPLQGTSLGVVIVVTVWVLVSGLMGFIKMGITTLFRPDPGRGLYYTGVATQIGSFIGAIVTFILVNHTNTFHSYSPCDAFVKH